MTVHQTAYDTTACNGLLMQKTEDAIKQAEIKGDLVYGDIQYTCLLKKDTAGGALVPSFAHPLKVHFRGSEQDSLVIDVRPFVRVDMASMDYKIVSQVEYDLLNLRLALNHVWSNTPHGTSVIRDLSTLGMAIYSSWISESITKRFGLDPAEQTKLAMYSAYFYATLFIEKDTELTERDIVKMAGSISAATKINGQEVLAFIDSVKDLEMNNIHDFCKHAENLIDTVRLREFTAGILISIVGGTWFGANAKELTAIALEHPPTWIAILGTAFTSKVYKKAIITGLAERYSRRDLDKQFVQAIRVVTELAQR